MIYRFSAKYVIAIIMLTYTEIMAKATSDLAVTRRKLIIVSVVLMSLCTSVQAETNFTLWVIRRSTVDLYSWSSTASVQNCDLKATYIIHERRCASDEELFRGIRMY